MSGEVKHVPTKAEAACSLKLAGATYEEIASVLGFVSADAARTSVTKALASTVDEHTKEEMRAVAGARIERLLRSIWNKAINPESPEQMAAVRAARELNDRFIALYGLAEPVEMTLRTPTQNELNEWVASVLSATRPDVIEADVLDESMPELPPGQSDL